MKGIITLSIYLISFQILSQTKLKKTKNKIDTIQKLDEIIINSNLIFGNKYVASNRTSTKPLVSNLAFSFKSTYFVYIAHLLQKVQLLFALENILW